MTHFVLRFDEQEINHWAERYATNDQEIEIEQRIVPFMRREHYLTKSDFLFLCYWKSPRPKKQCARNDEDFIKEVTHTALTTTNEQLRIEVLTLLHGVSWPMASVILHWAAPAPYPILDFRALWSLSVEVPNVYDFTFWWNYTLACRQLAVKRSVTMRTLDRALWQYSDEKQKVSELR